MPNYYFSHQIDTREATFDREEFHHAIRVMRHKVGDQIAFLDGCGGIYRGDISAVDRRREIFRVAIAGQQQRQRRPPHLTLAVALPRRQKLNFLIQKAAELGVAEIIPFYSRRSCVRPLPAPAAQKKLAQWRKTALEAVKQCGNPFLPLIHPPLPLAALPERRREHDLGLFLHPPAASDFSLLAGQWPEKARIILAVGPEGGFAPEEEQQLITGDYTPVSLGKTILRLETAVLAAVIISQYLGNHFQGEKDLKN